VIVKIVEFRGPSGTVYKLRPLTLRDLLDHFDDLAVLDEEKFETTMAKTMVENCILEPSLDEIPLGVWIKDQVAVVEKIAEISELPFRAEPAGKKITEPGWSREDLDGTAKSASRPRPR